MSRNDSEQIERPKSLTEMAIDRLRISIMEGDLSLGQALSETMLAKKFGVSKTPVREALFRLKQEGVIDIIPQKGSFVFLPDPKAVNDLCDFRAYVEPLALREAFSENNDDFMDSLEMTLLKMKRMLKRGDLVEYLRLDSEFHQLFFDHCKNPYLKEAYKLVSTKAAALRSHLSMNELKASQSNVQHVELVAFLNDGKIDEAVKVITEHVLNIKQAYLVEKVG